MTNDFAIKASNLACKYSREYVFEGLNFTVPKGKILSIVGPNGAGKSSFLKMILRLVKPANGEITFNPDYNKIAYVPQVKTADRTFPAKSYELIATGITNTWLPFIGKKMKSQIEKALDDVGALDLFDKQIGSLSGGELQKVFIARAMVSNPNILLLDEPVTGIDLICETKINSAIRRINNDADATVIMVTHDISAAYDHSELILMLNKKQIYFGSKENAFNDENLRHTFSASNHHHGAVLELKTEDAHEH